LKKPLTRLVRPKNQRTLTLDPMTSSHTQAGNGWLNLTVELTGEDLVGYVRDAEESLAQELKVDGFRPGKVPREVVRQRVGETAILEAALQAAVEHSLAQTIAKEKFDVIETADLSVKENSSSKLLYSVKIRVFPEVKLPALASVKIPRRDVLVTPEEIDQALAEIKAARAVLADKNGPAAAGDRIEIDFTIRRDGKTIENGESKNHPVLIGKGNFVPGFEDQLVGLSKGDSKQFSLEIPRDFANKDIAGRKLDFEVRVLDVKSVTLPEMTDQFARTLGKFDNIDQLILSVKDGLMLEKTGKETERVRQEITRALAEKSACKVSPEMVENQLASMVQSFDQDLHRHDMELGVYLAKIGKTQEDLKKEWRPEAERQVKLALISHAVARDNDITVTKEETDEALESLIQTAMLREGSSPSNLNIERLRSTIQSRLLNEKVLEFLERVCAVLPSAKS